MANNNKKMYITHVHDTYITYYSYRKIKSEKKKSFYYPTRSREIDKMFACLVDLHVVMVKFIYIYLQL
jgi:hypothetical protein